ncbi:MAG: DUF2188 domain-containing protein [Methyloceanibacter sp.]
MTKLVYQIVRHEDGWAYQVRGTFSETFPTHEAALAAARTAAGEQRVPGETVGIQYETAEGKWHEEVDPGTDRPHTEVKDA